MSDRKGTGTEKKSEPRADSSASKAEFLLGVLDSLTGLSSLQEQMDLLIGIASEATGADRSTLFLYDELTGDLVARHGQGEVLTEVRTSTSSGIAGDVFSTGESQLVTNAYRDTRFNKTIDEKTGYKTKNILASPIRTRRGEVIGVVEALNKLKGRFTRKDLEMLESICEVAAIVLRASLSVSRMEENQRREAEMLGVVTEISSEIQLGPLLQMIMSMVTRMLNAERSTLFLNDEQTNELYTEIGEGLGAIRIRVPNDQGIAGTVFQTAESVNIPHAYADLRFNPATDRRTGFFTRSILCVPVLNKQGRVIGVTQVLNKVGGTFTRDDQNRLRAFTAQISIALENAKLFDEMQSIKNYNESILESMSNGVVTFDQEGKIVTCNKAGLRILGVTPEHVMGQAANEFFTGASTWVRHSIRTVEAERRPVVTMDAELDVPQGKISANVSVLPLTSGKDESLGSMMLIEDISTEKRVRATMSRYVDPALANKLMEAGEEVLGGQTSVATVLFSDVRSFTTLTEQLGATGTVALLNEYFTIMVECIQKHGGMLDKFIGDAIMAIFGTPLAHEDDPDRGVRTAIEMMRELGKFNQKRTDRGEKPIDIGIGLNTDQVVSGNIGSPKRMDYTVIGDGVNLAARLESACKQYGAHVLISEYTFSQLRGTYRAREIDLVVVKGKTEPVHVYEILDYHTPKTFPSMADVLGHFRNGVEQYRQGNWDKAIAGFEEALRIHPEDKTSKLYLSRCADLKEHPPEEEWKGVWVMESK